MRLDVYISENNDGISRSRAKALIESGGVTVDGKTVTKTSFQVDHDVRIEINEDLIPYVSRGGLKLEGALDAFGVDPEGRVCADIGASTGGFTDCLLSRGARKVYAVDSGKDQLADKLKNDPRVVSLEGFNARNLTEETFGERVSLAVADLSFISETLVLPAVSLILETDGIYVGLIKPQFECGKEALGGGGIVRNRKYHKKAIRRVLDASAAASLDPQRVIRSPIKGGDGNTEFLFFAIKKDAPSPCTVSDAMIDEII